MSGPEKIKIGVSACLLGNKVRYDGGHKYDRVLARTLGKRFELAPLCPEVEAGLSIPREPMELYGSSSMPRLRVIGCDIDLTGVLKAWARKKVKWIERENIRGFLLKSRSPSCAVHDATIITAGGRKKGQGLFRFLLADSLPSIPVADEEELADPVFRENFVERVFVYHRWKNLCSSRPSVAKLASFHSDHRFVIRAHSPKHYSSLGRIVAHAKARPVREVYDAYVKCLMEGLKLIATPKKNAAVQRSLIR